MVYKPYVFAKKKNTEMFGWLIGYECGFQKQITSRRSGAKKCSHWKSCGVWQPQNDMEMSQNARPI